LIQIKEKTLGQQLTTTELEKIGFEELIGIKWGGG